MVSDTGPLSTILSSKIKDNETKAKAPVCKRNSLVNGRIEMVRCSEQNCDDEQLLYKPNTFPEDRYLFDERLCGITSVSRFDMLQNIWNFSCLCSKGTGMISGFLF